jgi:hypothetical protein
MSTPTTQNPLLRIVRDLANVGHKDALAIALHLSDEENERPPLLTMYETELGSLVFRFDIA